MKRPLTASGVTSFIAKKEEEAKPTGKPLDLDLSLLDDDPFNRKRINEKEFQDLFDDIQENGVKEPIGVRDNPNKPGRFIINSGHQRKKICLMQGKTTIPGFINNDFDEFDTMRVNIKKCNVDPKDMLDLVQYKLGEGMKAGEIAKRLSVSASLISQYIALTRLPPMLDEIFQSEKCTDVTLITELAKLYEQDQVEVAKFLDNHQDDLNRDNVKQLRAFIKSTEKNTENSGDDDDKTEETKTQTNQKKQEHKEPDLLKVKKPLLIVTYMGQAAHLLIKKRPKQEHFWIKICGNGEEIEVPAQHVALSELVDASEG